MLERPRTRADCEGTPRPCPWVSCPHHLYLDVSRRTGEVAVRFPDREPEDLEDSCALDVAERGGATHEEIATRVGVSRERVRALELRALIKLRSAMEHAR